MEETPQAASATLRPKPPLWKRVRAWTIISVLYAGVFGLGWAGFLFLRHALRFGMHVDDRIYYGMTGAAMLFIPIRVGWIFLGTKLSTGRWLKTKEADAQQRAQCAAVRSAPMQVPPNSWLVFATNWATFAANDVAAPLWKRILGWALIVFLFAALLATAALGVIFIGAGLDNFLSLGWMMIVFGIALLFIPAVTVWSFLKRKRTTGHWSTSQEELQQYQDRTEQWKVRESQKPLRSKIISTIIYVAALALWWIRDTVYHSRHSHESWTTPALYTVFAAYVIYVQFRKPKPSPPQSRAQ